jgi:hypothetical protein
MVWAQFEVEVHLIRADWLLTLGMIHILAGIACGKATYSVH